MSSVAMGKVRRPIAFPSFKPQSLYNSVIFVIVLAAVASPVAFLVLGSFSTVQFPSDFSLFGLTLSNYAKVWGDPDTYSVIGNTLLFAVGSTLLGIAIATSLAYLVERTDVSWKAVIYAGVPMTLAMPGTLQSMAWVLMGSPRIGFINLVLMELFGLQQAPISIYSLGGMIFIEALRTVPTAFLMLIPLMRSMDPSLEEAAAMSGAKPSRVMRKVTIGLMLPGLVAVAIYQFTGALESFEVPGVLGMPASIFVFSTKIYSILHSATALPAYGEANALAMLYLAVAVAGVYFYGRVIAKSERFTTITGKGFRPRLQRLGRWRGLALAFAMTYLALAAVLPTLTLAFISFLPYPQLPSLDAFASFTLKNYRALTELDAVRSTLWNTFIMTMTTATGVVVLSLLVSMVIVRSKFWGRRLLDQLAFIPHSIPGIVMGLALLWMFLQFDKLGAGLFGSLTSLVIAFVIGFMSYGTRVMNAAILQIHKDLEEAAQTSGARQWRVMWRIFVPLLAPALAGVWIWTVLHAVRIAGVPLMLTDGAENQVLAVALWNMWDGGELVVVGALGTLFILSLFLLTLVVRLFGFGRSAHIQGGN